MRTITNEVDIRCSAEELFAALHTPTAICIWWNARNAIIIPERNGLWVATWGKDPDSPDFVTAATISEFEPPRRMVLKDYRYRVHGEDTLKFAGKLQTEFLVEQNVESTRFQIVQSGFPDDPAADQFYDSCVRGWVQTLDSISCYFQGDSIPFD